MSETPGRVLYRLVTDRWGDAPPAGYEWPGLFEGADEGWEAVAAAFLAEVDIVTLLKAAKGRVGHAPGEWGDE